MSTRQYVGARYVPKFSEPIAWDKKRGYEALEIVTYLGTSYTSKKPVPAGTEIDNEEFWVVTETITHRWKSIGRKHKK